MLPEDVDLHMENTVRVQSSRPSLFLWLVGDFHSAELLHVLSQDQTPSLLSHVTARP